MRTRAFFDNCDVARGPTAVHLGTKPEENNVRIVSAAHRMAREGKRTSVCKRRTKSGRNARSGPDTCRRSSESRGPRQQPLFYISQSCTPAIDAMSRYRGANHLVHVSHPHPSSLNPVHGTTERNLVGGEAEAKSRNGRGEWTRRQGRKKQKRHKEKKKAGGEREPS
ncbi:unnamed protein product [Xylocopa violacea]|uniref:Uncharacterized protein n=1 Tax=Xylocopa violacea TaxID=135666 RepID=A0ABP1NZ03_XYLVO